MNTSLRQLICGISFFCGLVASTPATASSKIKYFFNRPVDTTVATCGSAIYLRNCIADTLAAYLGRAKYSLDVCVYDFDKTYSYNNSTIDTQFAPEIALAVNSAYRRGVKVRWIYEGSNSNTGLSLLDGGIPRLGSPQGGNYTIMHNKFVVIDANSPNPADATVWTGCLNWYVQQFNNDYNNVVVFQDSALAHAYLGEFNQMWGDTGTTPNSAVSKFGMYKTDLGRHHFTIDGNHVELYFSPSDGTETHIQSTISTANTDMYFGMYTFTSSADANLIMSKYNAGVYVAGLDDSWSNSYTPHSIFTSGLGSNFKVYTETSNSLYHNKFLIVDPSDPCSDPMVFTGSHNWSISANTKNDENSVIIHDDTAANLYYQYFKATFNSLGGTLTQQHGCTPTEVGGVTTPTVPTLYPNPTTGGCTITYSLTATERVSISVYNTNGQLVAKLAEGAQEPGLHCVSYLPSSSGIYFVQIITGKQSVVQTLTVIE